MCGRDGFPAIATLLHGDVIDVLEGITDLSIDINEGLGAHFAHTVRALNSALPNFFEDFATSKI